MARLRPLPFREVKRKLEEAGFVEASQRGSHIKYIQSTSEGIRVVIVPRHSDIPIGTLRSILNQAGLSPEEFDNL